MFFSIFFFWIKTLGIFIYSKFYLIAVSLCRKLTDFYFNYFNFGLRELRFKDNTVINFFFNIF